MACQKGIPLLRQGVELKALLLGLGKPATSKGIISALEEFGGNMVPTVGDGHRRNSRFTAF